mgnify:CR=1 FL=1|jgi:hypothetical protein
MEESGSGLAHTDWDYPATPALCVRLNVLMQSLLIVNRLGFIFPQRITTVRLLRQTIAVTAEPIGS